jgi:kynurenine formamidase
MVGVDTLSVDKDQADSDPAHNLLLSHRIPVVENLRNLEKLHDKRGYFIALPLLIRDGSASPVRPVVLVDRT